ncbi:hypothetical protein ACFO9Q_04385 [Paenibacillus sp. GCM10023252]|uniref:hypothetical protein n=1 Tax=Paenibacillus sp. GCM10023252 TaxID=3252649 RepID=UPI0036163E46
MTYQEKKSIVSILSTIFIFGFYIVYRYIQYPDEGVVGTAIFHYWGSFVLILALVSIIAHIVISIIFIIVYRLTTGEEEPRFTDELDQLINLKAYRNSFFVFVSGFLLAMVSQVLDQPVPAMFLILISSGFLSDVTTSVTRLYHYRRGV